MGKINIPPLVKFFCGLIFREDFDFASLKTLIQPLWGKIDFESEKIPFTFTNYYTAEMGQPLFRVFWSFEHLIERELLIERKLKSNEIEMSYASNGKRPVNIDPGYLTLGQLILASTKDNEQRIYLGQGIFAEVTLRYSAGKFHPYPWTYRDYASPEYHLLFLKMREMLYMQMKR